MKTAPFFSCGLAAMAAIFVSPCLADCPGQSGSSADPGQTGSSQDPGQSGSADPGQTGSSSSSAFDPKKGSSKDNSFLKSGANSAEDGVLVNNETVYLVRGGLARRVDAALVPAGQMLTVEGQAVPIPENVIGLGATGAARAVAGANSSASPSQPSAGASATSQTGIVIQGGTTYLIRAGQATKLDSTTVPSGQMMTFGGDVVRAPENIQGLNESTGVSGGGKPDVKR
jgi:hypothetical protein